MTFEYSSCLPLSRRLDFDSLLLEPLSRAVFQSSHRLGQRFGPVVLKDLTAVVQRPCDKAKAFLVANLNVSVSYPLGDGGELVFNRLPFGGRLDLAGGSGLLLVTHELIVGVIDLGQLALDDDLDSDFFQVRDQFLPACITPDMDAMRPTRTPGLRMDSARRLARSLTVGVCSISFIARSSP